MMKGMFNSSTSNTIASALTFRFHPVFVTKAVVIPSLRLSPFRLLMTRYPACSNISAIILLVEVFPLVPVTKITGQLIFRSFNKEGLILNLIDPGKDPPLCIKCSKNEDNLVMRIAMLVIWFLLCEVSLLLTYTLYMD